MLIFHLKFNILDDPIRFFGVLGLSLAVGAILASLWFWTPQFPSLSQSSFTGDRILPESLEQHWIVSGKEAKILLDQGATLLDARSMKILRSKPLKNAVFVRWQDFSMPDLPHRGQLLWDDQILTQKLQSLGIWKDRPVIVYSNPKTGWGEEGRIVWMLRSFGHSQAVWVDGGYEALVQAGVPLKKSRKFSPLKGDFQVERRRDWILGREQLKSRLDDKNLVMIDSRELREYHGKTPYGEQRGGHIPGAIHLYYRDLLDLNGQLLSRQDILEKLAENGIKLDGEIVSYCTGGVRSAWLTSVLVDLGLTAKNYPGSMWEWSAAPAPAYPLEK
ncbi:MAG: rhodanese-like domain-containing protein [Cyanobacteria bacterium J06592_8]